MDVGLGGTHRLFENMRDLVVAQALQVTQDDGHTVARRETFEGTVYCGRGLTLLGAGFGPFEPVGFEDEGVVDLDRGRAPRTIAHLIERDRKEPSPQRYRTPSLRIVLLERRIGGNKSVLRDFFGFRVVPDQR